MEAPDTTHRLYEPSVRLNADGSLATPRHERLAIRVAEGFTENEAWVQIGGETAKGAGSRKYGKRIYRNAVFIERVKVLAEEREALEADPIWGRPTWMANQLWREAMATSDVKTLQAALEIRFKIATNKQNEGGGREAAADGEDDGIVKDGKRRPGKPTAENPQTRRDPAQIKAALMAMGRPKKPDEESDSDAEDE